MDESSLAPEEFHISTGLEEEMCGTVTRGLDEDLRVLRCPLCKLHKSSFFCESCFRNGDLRHTKATGIYEDDYSKKVADLTRLQDRLQTLNTACERTMAKSVQFETIKQQIDKRRFRVECLRAIVEEKKREVARKKQLSIEFLQRTKELKRTIPRYHCKVQEMEDYVLNKKNNLGRKLTERTMLERNVRTVARQCVQKLVKFIFPIERVSNAESQTSPWCPSTAKELAEATRTAYVEGHWVLQDSSGSGTSTGTVPSPTGIVPYSASSSSFSSSSKSGSVVDVQYVIVAPSLPSDGNYRAYGEWFMKNRDTLPNTPTVDKDVRINENPAFRMLGALTYTAHFIQVLGYYLDVRFPFKVSASDFCTGFLSDAKFHKRVTRLNANIVHLLYTQGLKLNDIQPAQSLKNLAVLLQVIERGEDRVQRFVDPSNVNFNLIDEHFSPILLTDSCTDTDEDGEMEEEGIINLWRRLLFIILFYFFQTRPACKRSGRHWILFRHRFSTVQEAQRQLDNTRILYKRPV